MIEPTRLLDNLEIALEKMDGSRSISHIEISPCLYRACLANEHKLICRNITEKNILFFGGIFAKKVYIIKGLTPHWKIISTNISKNLLDTEKIDPGCFESNPNPQEQAENCCNSCELKTDCIRPMAKPPIDLTYICPHCHKADTIAGVTPEQLMQWFTEHNKTKIFKRETFDLWFHTIYGGVENYEVLAQNILTSKGVTWVKGDFILYTSPYSGAAQENEGNS